MRHWNLQEIHFIHIFMKYIRNFQNREIWSAPAYDRCRCIFITEEINPLIHRYFFICRLKLFHSLLQHAGSHHGFFCYMSKFSMFIACIPEDCSRRSKRKTGGNSIVREFKSSIRSARNISFIEEFPSLNIHKTRIKGFITLIAIGKRFINEMDNRSLIAFGKIKNSLCSIKTVFDVPRTYNYPGKLTMGSVNDESKVILRMARR